MAILLGKGIGPIRPGATVATLERHMEAKCPELTEKRCRYVDRGVEFDLDENQVTRRIRIHRVGRATGGDVAWGPFNGAIPPDLVPGMIPGAIEEFLGKPARVVQGAEGAHPDTVEQHHYEGAVLEYDRMASGGLVLGGIRIPD
jgi:hypothetical protein